MVLREPSIPYEATNAADFGPEMGFGWRVPDPFSSPSAMASCHVSNLPRASAPLGMGSSELLWRLRFNLWVKQVKMAYLAWHGKGGCKHHKQENDSRRHPHLSFPYPQFPSPPLKHKLLPLSSLTIIAPIEKTQLCDFTVNYEINFQPSILDIPHLSFP